MTQSFLENNDDSATSAAECQSENHHTKCNKPSVQYFDDDSSESLPGIYGSDDFDKYKTYHVSSPEDEISNDSWESENSDAILNDSEMTKTHSICAVSYTHLDVYKRQPSACRKFPLSPVRRSPAVYKFDSIILGIDVRPRIGYLLLCYTLFLLLLVHFKLSWQLSLIHI